MPPGPEEPGRDPNYADYRVAVDGRVIHPWFESFAYRIGVIAHQLDLRKVPQPLRSYLVRGKTPEVKEELKKIGLPRSTPRKKVLTYDLIKCW